MCRPLKYDFDKYEKLYIEYIESCKDIHEKFLKSESFSGTGESKSYEYKLNVNFPSIFNFAKYCGISRDTLYDWANKYPEFSYIMEDLKNNQVDRLINGGLSGRYNSRIVKLILSKHGYIEQKKVETDINATILNSDNLIKQLCAKRDVVVTG
ncbi:MAG: terminase small subunit [Candidatus Gracilibacteria bacterium]